MHWLTSRAGPDDLALAASSANVAEVLEIMGQPGPPHFQQLYKVYEIIEHAGDLRAAAQSAGVPQSELSLFTRTANHQAASGTESRHARSNQQPPTDPMPIGRARFDDQRPRHRLAVTPEIQDRTVTR
jgi:hypothetical protein